VADEAEAAGRRDQQRERRKPGLGGGQGVAGLADDPWGGQGGAEGRNGRAALASHRAASVAGGGAPALGAAAVGSVSAVGPSARRRPLAA
jgi:hypothetical protein